MSLADLTGHLEDLASSQSGLRRSRAMAQLWSEIRSSDVEERRAFALALADRFAPALTAKFEEASGLDGPEFIRLVRSLIEMDGDDISDVVSDLQRLVDNPELFAQEVTVAELIDAADQLTDESGRDDLMSAVFERLVDEVDESAESDEMLIEAMAPPLSDLPVPGPALVSDVGDEEPGESLELLTPYDLAIDRMENIDDARIAPVPKVAREISPRSVAGEPVSSGETMHSPRRESRPSADQPTRDATASATSNRAAVEAVPDGWRRRRAISSLIRENRIGVGEALALSDRLARPSDVRWIIGDLIERELTLSDRALLASRELPNNLRHRLEHSR